MGATKIEWCDKSWSPIRAKVKADAGEIAEAKGYSSLVQIATKMAGHVGPHCENVSPGCENCYSDTNNSRCLPANGTGLPFDRRSRDLVDIFVDEKILVQPLKWRKPVKIFVENQSDLFGEFVPDEMIDRVFAVMAFCHQHTFQVLTKREDRMREWASGSTSRWGTRHTPVISAMNALGVERENIAAIRWPLPNVWLGVSVENQETADARIPLLLKSPAAVRFVSYEPALGPVDFDPLWLHPELSGWWDGQRIARGKGAIHEVDHPLKDATRGLDWIIIGGESGPGARPFDIQWARAPIEQCRAAGVACFVKQAGAFVISSDTNDWTGHRGTEALTGNGLEQRWRILLDDKKGGSPEEWPEWMRVREFPEYVVGQRGES